MSKTKSDRIIDAMLVLQCKSGNKKAFAVLVKRWHHRLCKQANWYVQDIDLAKDITQDSWGTILTKIYYLRDVNSFGSWALQIVTRKAIDWLNKNNKELTVLRTHYNSSHRDVSIPDAPSLDPDLLVLRAAIKKLPVKQQEILNLYYMEELSIKQIGDVLDVSAGTVKSRLFTAREKLKTIFKNKNDEK